MIDAAFENPSTQAPRGDLSGGAFRWREPCVAGALIVLALVLISRCYDVGFLPYDDSAHTFRNSQVLHESVPEVFVPEKGSTYFPLTVLSYKLDRALFDEPGRVKSPRWAQGIRLFNVLYHAMAAYFLWRLFLALGFSPVEAFLSAAVFAAHPLACESVCWVSERKNVLAGMFGVAAAWIFVAFRSSRGLLMAVLLYGAALLSKPSALGLLPVFGFLELFFLKRWLPFSGAKEESSSAWRSALRILPLAILCAMVLPPNMQGHSGTILPPPGGSMYTALLTDVEILARYLKGIFLPTGLSASYYVQPIVSLSDARLWTYSAALVGVVAVTVSVARERRRAVLGWLWFFSALAPHYNLVALSQLMQDRYVYVAMPGALLAVEEASSGLLTRARLPGRMVAVLGGVVVLTLVALGSERGGLFANTYFLFRDAVEKQPQSAHAQFGLSLAWRMIYESRQRSGTATREEIEEALRNSGAHALLAYQCPDVERQLHYSRICTAGGEYRWRSGYPEEGRRMLEQAVRGLPAGPRDAGSILEAWTVFAELSMEQRQFEEALKQAREGAKISELEPRANLVRARAALGVAESTADEAIRAALRDEARACLARIPAGTEWFEPAKALLGTLSR